MSPKGSLESLADAVAILDRCLQSAGEGIMLFFDTGKAATTFRHRLYTARVRDREQSMKLYEPADPTYGKSQWDGVTIRLMSPSETETELWGLRLSKPTATNIPGLVSIEE